MLQAVLLLGVFSSATGWKCNNTCVTNFHDISLEPVGCNETSMWTFTSSSKLSCALYCVSSKSCGVFIYSSDSDVCSICYAELIQNLTFNTDKVYSWPYKYQEINPASTVSKVNRFFSIPNGINIGSV
ncbi:hypothetical protein BgiMline_032002, partial [Biomphalaria glabrata]